MKDIHKKINPGIPVEYFHCPAPEENDRGLEGMLSGSIVANATGMNVAKRGMHGPTVESGTPLKEVVDLYETALLPQAEQAFDASQTGFETGSIGFLDWLDTERTYLQTRLAYYKSIVDYNKLVAQLERLVGEEL